MAIGHEITEVTPKIPLPIFLIIYFPVIRSIVGGLDFSCKYLSINSPMWNTTVSLKRNLANHIESGSIKYNMPTQRMVF